MNCFRSSLSVSKGTDIITYIYSAQGEKLAKKMTNGTYKYYAGNMVYNKDKLLDYLLFDEGVVTKTLTLYSYEYHLKDHLGNARVAFQPNGPTTTTTQVAEYYPFGSSYLPVSPIGTNKYLYNGKEKQDDVLGGTALDWYDYGARFYDPTIGRWQTPDPLAEWHFNFTPYSYVINNPMRYIDLYGLSEDDPIELEGITVIGHYSPDWSDMFVNGFLNYLNDFSGFFDQGNHTYKQPYGENWTSMDGHELTNEMAKANKYGPGGNIDLLLAMDPSAGSVKLPPSWADIRRLFFDIGKTIKPTANEKTDRGILENHGGSQKIKTGNSVNTIIELQKPYKIDTMYTISHSPGTAWWDDNTKKYPEGDTMGVTIGYGPRRSGGYDSITFNKW